MRLGERLRERLRQFAGGAVSVVTAPIKAAWDVAVFIVEVFAYCKLFVWAMWALVIIQAARLIVEARRT